MFFALLPLLAAMVSPGAAQEPARRYYYEEIFSPFFREDPLQGLYRSSRPGSVPSTFAARKGKDGYRVFVVGGSIARRYMQGADALESAFRRALPAKKVEAINCGMGVYDSYREALVVEEVIGYQPDLIVLMSGHNETLGSPPIPLWLLHAQDRLARIKDYLALPRTAPPRPLWLQPDPAKARAEADRAFADNLRQMVRRAKARGVDIALVVPPLNYRDALTREEPPLQDRDFAKGWVSFLNSDPESAITAWKAEVSRPGPRRPGDPVVYFYLGRAEEKLLHPDAASRYYAAAMAADDDWMLGGRCTTRCQNIIRQVAADEGAALVDVDAAFRKHEPHGMPGLDMFEDAVHWSHDYDWLVSASLLEALKLPAGRGVPAPKRTQQDVDALNTLRYALSAMDSGDKKLSWRAVCYLEYVYRRHPEFFRDPKTLVKRAGLEQSWLGWAWSRRPPRVPMAALFWYVGEVFLRHGEYPRALDCFSQALEADPSWHRIRLSEGLARGLAKDFSGARAAFASVIAEEPQLMPEVLALADALGLAQEWGVDFLLAEARAYVGMGRGGEASAVLARVQKMSPDREQKHKAALVYQDVKDYDRALAILNGLTAESPGDLNFLVSRGVCEYHAGFIAQAEESLAKAVGLDAGFMPAYLSLGYILEEQGRYPEAAGLYRRALPRAQASDPMRRLVDEALRRAGAKER